MTNMGTLDRGLRLVIAALLVLAALGTTALGEGMLFWLALAVAAVFTVTSLLGHCPLYRLVGLSTCRAQR